MDKEDIPALVAVKPGLLMSARHQCCEVALDHEKNLDNFTIHRLRRRKWHVALHFCWNTVITYTP